ncbi:MAG TPA: regulator, partial [Gammaproteobacteria bacterium]|nr:regulator [Gammaproteobacteria bacterium]
RNAAAVGLDKLAGSGVLYHGLELLGSGAILTSLILAAVAACIIDRAYQRAAGFALAGAVMTFMGFMHSESIGLGHNPATALAYLTMAAGLYGYARVAVPASDLSLAAQPQLRSSV